MAPPKRFRQQFLVSGNPERSRPFSLGVNIDYNFYPNLAFRVSPTYLGTFYRRPPADVNHGPDGTIQNNFGFNAGIVYRFGKIK